MEDTEKSNFLDGSQGIRQENLSVCYIFKANLEVLKHEAGKLLKDFDARSRKSYVSECFECGTKKQSMNQCSCCKLAKYCSKVI